jgi:membrane protein implicated in regulation of membrane protease activity
MNNTTEFITDFMVWVTQFVVVSTVLLVSTHLFAKKRREQKRRAELLAEEQGDVTRPVEEAEPVSFG